MRHVSSFCFQRIPTAMASAAANEGDSAGKTPVFKPISADDDAQVTPTNVESYCVNCQSNVSIGRRASVHFSLHLCNPSPTARTCKTVSSESWLGCHYIAVTGVGLLSP